jgi:serine/threonine protein kinase
LLDSFEDTEGGLNLVLEYAAGGDFYELFDHIDLPQKVAIRIMRELAQGLIQIHGQGVYHGDIKGDNILIMGDPLIWESETPLVKYADFGVSSFKIEAEYIEHDVATTVPLIQRVARLAFNKQQLSEHIVMRQGMTAKDVLAMVEALA